MSMIEGKLVSIFSTVDLERTPKNALSIGVWGVSRLTAFCTFDLY